MSNLEKITALRIHGVNVSLPVVLRTLLVAGKKGFLQAAAEELVTAKAAKSLRIKVSNQELQIAADAFRRQRGLVSADATNLWLTSQGWTAEIFEQHLERKLIRSRIVEQIASAEKIEAHFAEHRRAYDQAQLARIVVETESLAAELLAQIEDDDASFAELARQHSTDATSSAMGGELGVTDRTTLPASLETLVFAAEDGDVVGPVRTDDGYELIKVHRLSLGTLDKNVTEAVRHDLFTQWVTEQMREANVVYSLFDSIE